LETNQSRNIPRTRQHAQNNLLPCIITILYHTETTSFLSRFSLLVKTAKKKKTTQPVHDRFDDPDPHISPSFSLTQSASFPPFPSFFPFPSLSLSSRSLHPLFLFPLPSLYFPTLLRQDLVLLCSGSPRSFVERVAGIRSPWGRRDFEKQVNRDRVSLLVSFWGEGLFPFSLGFIFACINRDHQHNTSFHFSSCRGKTKRKKTFDVVLLIACYNTVFLDFPSCIFFPAKKVGEKGTQGETRLGKKKRRHDNSTFIFEDSFPLTTTLLPP
jgi:hypothetical protein